MRGALLGRWQGCSTASRSQSSLQGRLALTSHTTGPRCDDGRLTRAHAHLRSGGLSKWPTLLQYARTRWLGETRAASNTSTELIKSGRDRRREGGAAVEGLLLKLAAATDLQLGCARLSPSMRFTVAQSPWLISWLGCWLKSTAEWGCIRHLRSALRSAHFVQGGHNLLSCWRCGRCTHHFQTGRRRRGWSPAPTQESADAKNSTLLGSAPPEWQHG